MAISVELFPGPVKAKKRSSEIKVYGFPCFMASHTTNTYSLALWAGQ